MGDIASIIVVFFLYLFHLHIVWHVLDLSLDFLEVIIITLHSVSSIKIQGSVPSSQT
jgi:hypothetical protein